MPVLAMGGEMYGDSASRYKQLVAGMDHRNWSFDHFSFCLTTVVLCGAPTDGLLSTRFGAAFI